MSFAVATGACLFVTACSDGTTEEPLRTYDTASGAGAIADDGPAGGGFDGVSADGFEAVSTGGVASGGGSGSGTGGGGPVGAEPTLAERYPCEVGVDGYDHVVTGAGDSWLMNGDAHPSLLDALRAALDGGGVSPADPLTVLVADGGDVPDTQIRVFDNTVLNVCGALNVTGASGTGDRAPLYARGASNISVPHLIITGVAPYGVFMRDVDNVHFGEVDIRLAGGLGMRFDNNPAGNSWANSSSNAARRASFRLDEVYVDGVSHGVEFYGIDGIVIGEVVVRNASQAGLMLNNSRNVEVGLVDGRFVSPSAGYAVLRMANDNGKDWDSGTHPMTIHVERVVARESGGSNGQGIFCLTDSGGVTIDEVDIESTASSSIWLEWCTNVHIGSSAAPSRIHDSGNLMISYDDYLGSSRLSDQVVLENIAITDTSIRFNHDCPPSIDWIDVTQNGALVGICE